MNTLKIRELAAIPTAALALELAACGGNEPEPAGFNGAPTQSAQKDTIVRHGEAVYNFTGDGVRERLDYITAEPWLYDYCRDGRLITSESDDPSDEESIWSLSDKFEGCSDNFLSADDFAPGTEISHTRESQVKSIPSLMDTYGIMMAEDGTTTFASEDNYADSSAAYLDDSTAEFVFIEPMMAREKFVMSCEGEDSGVLTVTEPESRFENPDGTVTIYRAAVSTPEKGEDVCEDGSVTPEDEIEIRHEIQFQG